MRRLIFAVAMVTVAALAFVGLIYGVSELGPEIVTVRTTNADGTTVDTRLWIVDHQDAAWLRSGMKTSGWYVRLVANPSIEVERGGTWTRMHAQPIHDPDMRDRVHALMAEKYGLADTFISALRDGEQSVPIHLEPLNG